MSLKKTEAGLLELTQRQHELTRSQRTLLVLADGTRGPAQLLEMVRGAVAEDIARLQQLALLVEPAREGRVGGARDTEPASEPGALPADSLDYTETYTTLVALVREQLGLIKGFKFTLEIEKASGLAELQVVAQRFVAAVQQHKGPVAAKMARRALGLAPQPS